MRVAQQGWVRIHYQEQDAANLPGIFSAVDASYPLISENLGVGFSGALNIYLASNNAEFGELTGWRLPPWAQGVAMPKRKMVVLKSPRWSGTQVDLGRAAVHEFVHILIEEDVGEIPLWLNEGLAVMLSGEIYFDEHALSGAALTGRFIPFDEIESVMKFNGLKAGLAYQQSLSAVRYLVLEFGWGGVRKIISGLREGESFEDAFMDATGLWPFEFEHEWTKDRGKIHRFSFLKDIHYFIGFIFGPLVLITGGWLWLRRRKTIRRWEEEERFNDYSDY